MGGGAAKRARLGGGALELGVHDPKVAFEEGGLDGRTKAKVEVGGGPHGGVEGSMLADFFQEILCSFAESSIGFQDEGNEKRVLLSSHGGVPGGFGCGVGFCSCKWTEGGGGAVSRGGGVDDADIDEVGLGAKHNSNVAAAVIVPVVLAGFDPCSPSSLVNKVSDNVDDVVVAKDGEVSCFVNEAMPGVEV
jgi:hypothetical protein